MVFFFTWMEGYQQNKKMFVSFKKPLLYSDGFFLTQTADHCWILIIIPALWSVVLTARYGSHSTEVTEFTFTGVSVVN